MYKKVFDLVDEQVCGVVNTALALRTPGGMARFRTCLREEISSRLEIKEGFPPVAARDYKRKVLQVFAAHGVNVVRRRALLALAPNGDWRSNRVEFYKGGQHLTDRSAIEEHVSSGLVMALAAAQPHQYNRSKWTGSDIAVDDLAIFECVHGLLAPTFARFCATFLHGQKKQDLLLLAQTLARVDDFGRLEQLEDVEDAEPEAADPRDTPAAGAGAMQLGEAGGPTDAMAIAAEQNAKDRRKAMAFLAQRPLGYLVLLRLAMEPMRVYMGKQFDRAGDSWDKKQQALLAEAYMAGTLAAHKQVFRICQVAEGHDDRFFFRQLGMLSNSAYLWSVTPARWQTWKNRALGFKCLSRMGCAFERLLASRHRRCPHLTFLAIGNPDMCTRLQQMSSCLQDEWTKALLKQCPNLACDEAQHILRAIARQLKVDISVVEAKHATMRRLLTSRSVQTHVMSMPDLSSQFVLQQVRAGRSSTTSTQKPAGHRAKRKPKKGKDRRRGNKKKGQRRRPGAQPRPRSGKGGAWRAWVRMHAKAHWQGGIRIDMATIAALYNAAKRAGSEDYDRAVQIGKAATLRGRKTWLRSFGAKASQRKKSAEQLKRWALALRLQTHGEQAVEDSLAIAGRGEDFDLGPEGVLSALRQAGRAANARQRAEDERLQSILDKYKATVGGELVRGVKRAMPELNSAPLRAVPAVHGVSIECEGPAPLDVAHAVSWADADAQTSGLSTRISKHWDLLHRVLMEAECPDVPAAPAEPECYKHGVCFCSERGKILRRLVNKFLKVMKAECPVASSKKKDLVNGSLVVRLITGPGPGDDIAGPDAIILDKWFHIGLMYLSPYEPHFQEVLPIEDVAEAEPDRRRVWVTGAQRFVSAFVALQELQDAGTIASRWYRLEESERYVPDFQTQPLPLVELPGHSESKRFWPRAVAKQGGSRKTRAHRSSSSGRCRC